MRVVPYSMLMQVYVLGLIGGVILTCMVSKFMSNYRRLSRGQSRNNQGYTNTYSKVSNY